MVFGGCGAFLTPHRITRRVNCQTGSRDAAIGMMTGRAGLHVARVAARQKSRIGRLDDFWPIHGAMEAAPLVEIALSDFTNLS
jgi:hypothetical protein